MESLDGDVNWKDEGLEPSERAKRFLNDLKRLRRLGNLTNDVLEHWVAHLIHAVMADRLVKIAEEHREEKCPSCGELIYCHHRVELQRLVGQLRFERVGLKWDLERERKLTQELRERVRQLESNHRR